MSVVEKSNSALTCRCIAEHVPASQTQYQSHFQRKMVCLLKFRSLKDKKISLRLKKPELSCKIKLNYLLTPDRNVSFSGDVLIYSRLSSPISIYDTIHGPDLQLCCAVVSPLKHFGQKRKQECFLPAPSLGVGRRLGPRLRGCPLCVCHRPPVQAAQASLKYLRVSMVSANHHSYTCFVWGSAD